MVWGGPGKMMRIRPYSQFFGQKICTRIFMFLRNGMSGVVVSKYAMLESLLTMSINRLADYLTFDLATDRFIVEPLLNPPPPWGRKLSDFRSSNIFLVH